MSLPVIILAVLGLAVVYAISIYNGLASFKNRIHASIQEIGNQLKRQADLIPNLEQSAKGYLKHEKEVFKLLTDARKAVQSAVSSGDLGNLSEAASKIADLLPRLQVIVESNPQIKGADVVTKLMDELRDTSDKVMYARRTLIDLVADYNIQLATFPSKLVADIFGFKPETGLETAKTGAHLSVAESETQTPKISL